MYKKKSLGQHFLHNKFYLQKIADATRIGAGTTVLEVGPGDGALTSVLLEQGARVVAVEKDARLIPLLREKFAGKDLTVVEGDALTFDISKVLKEREPFVLVGNIPYYITGALFKKFLSGAHQPVRLVFLIQKEVAERIARDRKESILSLSVKAYGTPRYLGKVPAGAFAPPPEVNSAILAVEDISRKNFANAAHEERFFELVRAGFAHKRKLLASNLKQNLGENYSDILKKAGIDEDVRAEDVPLEKWLALAELSI
jgi:16S rRNA (adenine1518-N6/adenine1519-N6)-dimethyltransferase